MKNERKKMLKERITILLKKASLEAEKKQLPILKEVDLTVSQYKFLKYLYQRSNENTRLTDLEDFFSLTHPAAIDIIKILEKKDYVKRVVNPNDKRSKLIVLTEKAIKNKDFLIDLGQDMEDSVTENLTEEEIKQLALLLKKILNCDTENLIEHNIKLPINKKE